MVSIIAIIIIVTVLIIAFLLKAPATMEMHHSFSCMCCRRRQALDVPGAMGAPDNAAAEEWDAMGTPDNAGAERGQRNAWQRLVSKIQSRKAWSDRGRMLNYAKHGLPKNLDGKPTGFGKHLGRWGWREIRSNW